MAAEVKNAWEKTYQSNQHLSVWPWTDLVAKAKRFCAPKPGARALELGVGMGANIPFFQAERMDYFGLEASPFAVKKIVSHFPELAGKVIEGDFTSEIPFEGYFDLIFDRGSMSHNILSQVQKSMDLIYAKLKPGGFFLGIDWYSRTNERSSEGRPHPKDSGCRIEFPVGPYEGIGPLRFFTKEEIVSVVGKFEILILEEKMSRKFLPQSEPLLASWDLVLRKP